MSELSNEFVTDTQAIVLWLEGRKIPAGVNIIFQSCKARTEGVTIWIPAMVLAEIGYLFEKGRIDTTLLDIESILSPSHYLSGFKVAELSSSIVSKSFEINDIPELHDRLIAGTAFCFNCELLTNDPKIEGSTFVTTIWN